MKYYHILNMLAGMKGALVNQKYLIYPDVFLRYVALWLYMVSNCLTPKAFIKDGF